MANQPKTPARTVRVSDVDWDAFNSHLRETSAAMGEAARTASDAIRAFIRSYSGPLPSFTAGYEAAFADLPEGMTKEDAEHRMGRAVPAIETVIRDEIATKLHRRLSQAALPVVARGNEAIVAVPLDEVRAAIEAARSVEG